MFSPVTIGPTRRTDAWGSGQYGAGRGDRRHHGLDIVARPTEAICSPIDGTVVREAYPYANDRRFRGLVIRGTGSWDGYEVKLFYVDGHFSGQVRAGQVVGRAQDLSGRYPGITNHVHLEVRERGRELSPSELFGLCF
jgi:murein DD-endopeptidase MepM/ murein hydrolase activator NlpD